MVSRKKETVLAARELLERVGWCKETAVVYAKPDDHRSGPVAFCVLGALCNAGLGRLSKAADDELFFELREFIRERTGNRHITASEWNDQQESVSSVLSMLDEFAARVES